MSDSLPTTFSCLGAFWLGFASAVVVVFVLVGLGACWAAFTEAPDEF